MDVNLEMSEAEVAVMDGLASEFGMSRSAVMRQALRFHQLMHRRLKDGETFSFSGDAARAREFAGPGAA